MKNNNKRPAGEPVEHRHWLLYLGLAVAAAVSLSQVVKATSALPDFRDYIAGPERKAAFFDYITPLVEAENQRIREQRAELLAIEAEESPGWFGKRRLVTIAKAYGVEDPDPEDPELMPVLKRRVDTVPLSLALAQAAKESGWGTSRFARQGNNLFGEWCFDDGCGIVPNARAEDRSHEVEAFFAPQNSVASYLRNINTHPKYREFRHERERLRRENRKLSGVTLASKLSQYSERRDAYVEELKQLILANDLESRPANDSD